MAALKSSAVSLLMHFVRKWIKSKFSFSNQTMWQQLWNVQHMHLLKFHLTTSRFQSFMIPWMPLCRLTDTRSRQRYPQAYWMGTMVLNCDARGSLRSLIPLSGSSSHLSENLLTNGSHKWARCFLKSWAKSAIKQCSWIIINLDNVAITCDTSWTESICKQVEWLTNKWCFNDNHMESYYGICQYTSLYFHKDVRNVPYIYAWFESKTNCSCTYAPCILPQCSSPQENLKMDGLEPGVVQMECLR